MSIDTLVSLSDLRRVIRTVGTDLTVYIQSEPGVGKTSLLAMLAQDLGDAYEYVYLDGPTLDIGDLFYRTPQDGKLVQSTSDIFKLASGKPLVILIDELGKCVPMMRTLFTRMMLERTIGDIPLPKGSIVFATSNNASDGVGDSLRGHEGNRVCVMNLRKPTGEQWAAWGGNNGVSPVTCAFAALTPAAFASYKDQGQQNNQMVFNPRTNNVSFLSPRSLYKADKAFVQNRTALGPDVTFAGLVGTIGRAGAEALAAFIALEKDIVPLKTIITDPAAAPVPEKLAAVYMTMFNAVEYITTQDELTATLQYLARTKSDELQSVYFAMLCQNQKTARLARGNATIRQWITDNHALVI
jgi:hypothetical protein